MQVAELLRANLARSAFVAALEEAVGELAEKLQGACAGAAAARGG